MGATKKVRFIVGLLLLAITFSCSHNEVIHFYSMDRTQGITVIVRGDVRYVINGIHKNIPEDNFVKLDTRAIPDLGDGLHICWQSERYEWEAVMHDAVIIESTLDSMRFDFKTSLPLENGHIPTELKFRADGCAIFDFYRMKLSPNTGAIIEFN